MDEFLKFKKMITPIIIQILFWIGAVCSVIFGLLSIISGLSADIGGGAMVFMGLITMVVGPVIARIYCEILIVIFSINDTLGEVRDLLKNKKEA